MAVERNIRILNVGRIDSNLHDLQDYQIPPKVNCTDFGGFMFVWVWVWV